MNDPLFGNKLAAAALAALLIFFGVGQLTAALFGGGHHGEELHLAYPIEFEREVAAAEEAAPELTLAQRLAEASASAGERRVAICKSCHSLEEGGANGAGPNLWNIVGREVASVDGFGYTSALQSFGGEWTFERLDGYLANSQEYVPGTAMVQRFPKADQRADLLAYLRTLSDDPAPLPEPEPQKEAAAGGETSQRAAVED